jgi:hypothetical protein
MAFKSGNYILGKYYLGKLKKLINKLKFNYINIIMFQLVYKDKNEIVWNYSFWANNISQFAKIIKGKEFFIRDKNYNIVYSS